MKWWDGMRLVEILTDNRMRPRAWTGVVPSPRKDDLLRSFIRWIRPIHSAHQKQRFCPFPHLNKCALLG